MRELYRRLAVFLLLFIALVCFFSVRGSFVRLYAADMGREYRSEYSPSQGCSERSRMGPFILVDHALPHHRRLHRFEN
jgi:hypothetical protein